VSARDAYDVVVVGAGAGGGVVAAVAAEAGLRVLLVERGDAVAGPELAHHQLHNHLNFRHPFRLTAPPGTHLRVLEAADGSTRVVQPPGWEHNNNANAVGGGTLIWGMQAWRFHPDDFRMASRYGVPDGSSLADWPITYDELEALYTRAEWELGVAGDGATSHVPRTRPYPLAPLAELPADRWLIEAARRRGVSTTAAPLAVNTAPRRGRPSCVRCNECIGFGCPVDAKNGSQNTYVARALETGSCTMLTGTRATEVLIDGSGRVDGVELVDRDGRRHAVRGRAVVLAAGAIETARLLLVSRHRVHPEGLGNHADHVGRHLQGHTYPSALGLMPPEIEPIDRGPGVRVATTDFVHGNPGVIGGAMLANDFVKPPAVHWAAMLPPGTPRWGRANKQAMRETFGRVMDVRGPVQEIPSPDSRVRLDPTIRDTLGVPVARLSGGLHPETVRTAELIREELVAWLHAGGAEPVWCPPIRGGMSVAHHQAGTARMSADPRDGVTDPSGRIHGHANVFVADASVHVTNGAFNPALTVFALAHRTADHVVAQCR
jgi:choline dehydrogenase-like flavoprotein